jgi:hypothetical protein
MSVMKLEDNLVLTPEVLRRLPCRGVMSPFYKIMEAVFVMAVKEFFKFPFFYQLGFAVLPF